MARLLDTKEEQLSHIQDEIVQMLWAAGREGLTVAEVAEKLSDSNLDDRRHSVWSTRRKIKMLVEKEVVGYKPPKGSTERFVQEPNGNPERFVLADEAPEYYIEQYYFCMKLVDKFLRHFIREAHEHQFDGALKKLEKVVQPSVRGPAREWLSKLKEHPRYPEIFHNDTTKSDVSSASRQNVHYALAHNYTISARYDQSDRFLLYPTRLVRRQKTTYVYGVRYDKQKRRIAGREDRFALHRLKYVELGAPVRHEVRPDPRPYVQKEKHKKIVIQITGIAATHFLTAFFTAEVSTEAIGDDENPVTRMTLKDAALDYELKAWMLGLGRELKVISPPEVKEELREEYLLALGHYE